MKLADKILDALKTDEQDIHEKILLEFGKKNRDDLLGYDVGGNAIMRPKTKPAEKKAIEKVKSEAEKMKKMLGGSEEGKSLFLRLMLGADSDKEAKAIIADILKAQKAKTPYVAVKSVPFTLPNFSWKGGVVGNPKDAASGKFLNNQFPNHDRKYQVLLDNLGKITEIHTSMDTPAHDVYMNGYKKGIKIFLYLVNKGDGTFPSDLRIAKAFKKLKDKGFDVELVGELSDADNGKVFGKDGVKETKLAERVINSLKPVSEKVSDQYLEDASMASDELDKVIKQAKDKNFKKLLSFVQKGLDAISQTDEKSSLAQFKAASDFIKSSKIEE